MTFNAAADLAKTSLSLKHFIYYLPVLLVLAACEAERAGPVGAGQEYFPLRTGMYHVYNVREVRYVNGSAPVTMDYQLKYEVVDSFPGKDERITYVIHRSKRSVEAETWEPLDTWSARKDSEKAIVSEGNTAFVKLAFPVRDGIRWDGNEYNALGADEYELTRVGDPMEVNGSSFRNTATIEQEANDDRIVYTDERREVYAPGAGLVFSQVRQLHYCTDDACLGQQIVDEGVELTMELEEYGDE